MTPALSWLWAALAGLTTGWVGAALLRPASLITPVNPIRPALISVPAETSPSAVPSYGLSHWQSLLAKASAGDGGSWASRLLAARDEPFLIQQLSEAWASTDPLGFLRWLGDTDQMDGVFEDCPLVLLRHWAGSDQQGLVQAVRSLAQSPGRSRLHHLLLWRVLDDRSLALELFARDPDILTGTFPYPYAGPMDAPWMVDDPGAAARAIWKAHPRDGEIPGFDEAARLWLLADPAAAAHWAAGEADGGRLIEAFAVWYEASPQAAITAIQSLPDGALRQSAWKTVLPVLSETDLTAALVVAEAAGWQETAGLARITLAVKTGAAPAALLALLTEAGGGSAGDAGSALEAVQPALEKAVREAPQAWVALLPGIPELDLRRRLAGEFACRWLEVDSDAALKWASTVEPPGLGESVWRNREFKSLLDADMEKSAQSAAKALATNPSIAMEVEENLRELLASGPVSQWSLLLALLPEPVQDRVTAQLLESVEVSNGTEALSLYEIIKTRRPAAEAAGKAGAAWFDDQPTESLEWMLSLPADERTAALEACQQMEGLDTGQKALLEQAVRK